MDAGLKSLLDLFRSAERFVIPEFQRPYCWTQKEGEGEVDQLWACQALLKGPELASRATRRHPSERPMAN